MQTVPFTRMADGTQADYQLLDQIEQQYRQRLPERLLAALERMDTRSPD